MLKVSTVESEKIDRCLLLVFRQHYGERDIWVNNYIDSGTPIGCRGESSQRIGMLSSNLIDHIITSKAMLYPESSAVRRAPTLVGAISSPCNPFVRNVPRLTDLSMEYCQLPQSAGQIVIGSAQLGI